jgi:hypothetical protein
MIVRGLNEPCKSAEVNGCRKLFLHQRFSMSIRAYHSPQIVHKTQSDKIAFPMSINAAQRKTLKRLGIVCSSPLPPSTATNNIYVAFSRSSSLVNFAFAVIDRISTANRKWQIHNIKHFISRSALKFQIYIITYFIVSTHELFARIQSVFSKFLNESTSLPAVFRHANGP